MFPSDDVILGKDALQVLWLYIMDLRYLSRVFLIVKSLFTVKTTTTATMVHHGAPPAMDTDPAIMGDYKDPQAPFPQPPPTYGYGGTADPASAPLYPQQRKFNKYAHLLKE